MWQAIRYTAERPRVLHRPTTSHTMSACVSQLMRGHHTVLAFSNTCPFSCPLTRAPLASPGSFLFLHSGFPEFPSLPPPPSVLSNPLRQFPICNAQIALNTQFHNYIFVNYPTEKFFKMCFLSPHFQCLAWPKVAQWVWWVEVLWTEFALSGLPRWLQVFQLGLCY